MDNAILPQDPISGSVKIIEPDHEKIHSGTHFTVTYKKTIAAAASVSSVMFTTPALTTGQYVHFVCGVEADKSVDWTFYQNTIASGGSALTAYNNNLNSALTNPVTVVANPVLTTTGTVLENHIAGSASTPQSKSGGGVVARNEWILAPATSYLIYVLSTEATTRTVIDAPYYYRY